MDDTVELPWPRQTDRFDKRGKEKAWSNLEIMLNPIPSLETDMRCKLLKLHGMVCIIYSAPVLL